MLCPNCNNRMVKNGKDQKFQQRYKCQKCKITKTDSKLNHFDEEAKRQVWQLLRAQYSVRQIAKILGFNHSLIFRYIKKEISK